MKAQASLEMVVGLIILLVVAGVVISLVLHYVNPENMPDPSEKIKKSEFTANCKDFCEDSTSIDYCTYYWGYEGKDSGTVSNKDWNGDQETNGLVTVGKWDTCENRVYCFLAQPCDRYGDGGIATLQKCKRIICQYYISKYGNTEEGIERATQALHDLIDISPCDFSSLNAADDWYISGGFDEDCS